MADTRLQVVVSAKDDASQVFKNLGSSLNNVSDKVGKVGSEFASMAKVGLGVAVAGTIALGGALYSCAQSAMEAQNAISQTYAVLESTGGIAGVTVGQVTELANALQKVTMFSDETVRGGENLLLTFTNIGKDIFPQATETMLDMSQALGQDVKSSAIQLGKALQDPILGVTALRRVGVNFNEAQAETIKKMVESGKMMEAQKYILKELQTEFGGAARAAGETFAGKLTILNNTFDDMKETIGFALLEGLDPLVNKFQEWATSDQAQAKIEAIADKVAEMSTKMLDWVTDVAIPWIQTHWPEIKRVVGETIDKVGDFIGKVADFVKKHPDFVLAITAIIVALQLLYLTHIPQAIIAIGNLIFALGTIPGLIFIGIAIDVLLWAEVYKQIKALKAEINSIPDKNVRIKLWFEAAGRLIAFPLVESYEEMHRRWPDIFKQQGGNISATGSYILHKGERVLPAGTFTGRGGQGNVINIYISGGIINKEGWSIDELQKQLGKAVQLAKMGV